MKEIIRWGIIGCGNVTEKKSGPAFKKVPQSTLVAVMRRNAGKAADYAARHAIPKWYSDADELLADPEINAVYIATPPSTHERYAIAALEKGMPVYLEKPMSLNAESAARIVETAKRHQQKLSIAHYRREQPLFKKVKSLLDNNSIGEIRCVNMRYYKAALSPERLTEPGVAWRVDQSISGGGLFHDLAPHQLDLMLYFFGKVKSAKGLASNQSAIYEAADAVAGTLEFESGAIFSGQWNFSVNSESELDSCEILGTEGKMSFPIFDHQKIELTTRNGREEMRFQPLEHVQQPMIAQVVQYFLGKSYNPGDGQNGVEVMRLIDAFTS